jgi:hypothetical protein
MTTAVVAVPGQGEVRHQSNNAAQRECHKREFEQLAHWMLPYSGPSSGFAKVILTAHDPQPDTQAGDTGADTISLHEKRKTRP